MTVLGKFRVSRIQDKQLKLDRDISVNHSTTESRIQALQ